MLIYPALAFRVQSNTSRYGEYPDYCYYYDWCTKEEESDLYYTYKLLAKRANSAPHSQNDERKLLAVKFGGAVISLWIPGPQPRNNLGITDTLYMAF